MVIETAEIQTALLLATGRKTSGHFAQRLLQEVRTVAPEIAATEVATRIREIACEQSIGRSLEWWVVVLKDQFEPVVYPPEIVAEVIRLYHQGLARKIMTILKLGEQVVGEIIWRYENGRNGVAPENKSNF